jgi:hypothetical protein
MQPENLKTQNLQSQNPQIPWQPKSWQAPIDGDAAPPRDKEEFRFALARKVMVFLKAWRTCPMRSCRRQHDCVSAKLACSKNPHRQLTPEEKAAMLAYLRRTLAQQLGAREEAGK